MAGNTQSTSKYGFYPGTTADGSFVVNGQLVGLPSQAVFNPINYLTVTSSPPLAPTSYPSTITSSPSGYPTVGAGVSNITPSTQQRGSTSLGVIDSPAWFAILMMGFGLLWIRYFHWKSFK